MSFLGLPDFFGKPLAVALIDLLLAGDNAVVLALVCRSLPQRRLRLVLLLGTLGAVVLRVALVGVAGTVLAVPGLKVAGGALLTLLAVNLARPEVRQRPKMSSLEGRSDLLAAALLVMLIDVLMSLDNVVALAAVAGDDVLYLGLGLVLSIAILMFGSGLVGQLLHRHPGLGRLGAALLGWVAGQMVLADRLIDGWIAVQAPALPVIVPVLAAVYVYLLGGGTAPAAMEPLPARPAIAPAPPPLGQTAEHPVASPILRPAARPVPRPDAPATKPIAVTPALTGGLAPPQTAASAPRRTELVLFGALFLVVGIFLGLAVLLGGGALDH